MNQIFFMYIIDNEWVRIALDAKGAELTSIYHKPSQLEYMWNGDPAFWAKHSPVLFPIVGGLKDNTYFYKNRFYQLPRHGFAREKYFSIIKQSGNSITFSLVHNEETLIVYPFEFELNITYTLDKNTVKVIYEVKNLVNEEMYFSIGGHPAFSVPLADDGFYEDYFLQFDMPENADRWAVSPDGLIEAHSIPFFKDSSTIPLTKTLFLQDALVFKNLSSNKVSLQNTKSAHGIDFYFQGFPYMGIWAAKKADFVCIEPWCGIADSVDTDQQLKNKEGINKLGRGEDFRREWQVSVY